MPVTGPEIDWLKEQSGYSDEDLKAFESVMGSAKFVSMLQKIQQAATQAAKDKADAESAVLEHNRKYNEEFVPEMRRVTQDALRAQGEAARMKAELDKAREYGIVPEEVKPTVPAEVRAPGSPDPAARQDEFKQWSRAQSVALNTVSEVNAEHFRLFKEPLPSTSDLADEVDRQRLLGHKDFTIRQAWEAKYKVPEKRAEIAKADQQKLIDDAVAAARKEDRQKAGAHPHLVSGQPSRFSSYKPSDASKDSEPWKTAPGMKKTANQPWRDKVVAKISAA